MDILIIFACAFVIIYVIICIVRKAKSKSKANKKAKKQNCEKKSPEEDLSQKFKSNAVVNQWAAEIADYIEGYILQYPYKSVEFHFKAYLEDFEYGLFLQDVWLPHVKKFISQDGKYSVKTYNFCEHGLPDLNRYGHQTDLFSIAVAELTADILIAKEYPVEVRRLIRVVDNHGYSVEGMDHLFGRIIYTPTKGQNEW